MAYGDYTQAGTNVDFTRVKTDTLINDLETITLSTEKLFERSNQDIVYASSITPDLDNGNIISVGALTGNLTINAPVNMRDNDMLIIKLIQDATGSRVVTWNAVFELNSEVSLIPLNKTVLSFIYDGSSWSEISKSIGDIQINPIEKTDDYVLTVLDLETSIRLKAGADKQFTLPSVGSSEDGKQINFLKGDVFKLTILAADSDLIADSAGGGTIYCSDLAASLTLEYYHSITTWVIISGNGTWTTT